MDDQNSMKLQEFLRIICLTCLVLNNIICRLISKQNSIKKKINVDDENFKVTGL